MSMTSLEKNVINVWVDNGSEMLYHASLSKEEYQSLLAQYHFEVVLHKIEDPDSGGATGWITRQQKVLKYDL
ncbi:MAG: hypothetical protein O2809_07230 [Proteobacteria bacterium]|nr:hypothetical protein [Pseudomonadota bacterium]